MSVLSYSINSVVICCWHKSVLSLCSLHHQTWACISCRVTHMTWTAFLVSASLPMIICRAVSVASCIMICVLTCTEVICSQQMFELYSGLNVLINSYFACDIEEKKNVTSEFRRTLKMLRSWVLCCLVTRNSIIIKCWSRILHHTSCILHVTV